jgi:hypothetical protein
MLGCDLIGEAGGRTASGERVAALDATYPENTASSSGYAAEKRSGRALTQP